MAAGWPKIAAATRPRCGRVCFGRSGAADFFLQDLEIGSFFLVILHCRCYDVFLNSLKTTHQRSPNLFKPSTVGPCRHQELVHRWCFPAIQLLGVPHIHMAAVGPLLAQKNLAPGCDSQQGFRQCGGRREQRCRLKSRFENHVGKTIINS